MKDKKSHYVYIVYCQDKTLYTGYSTDFWSRIKTHNAGKGAKYTKIRRPVRLLYVKEYEDKSSALKAEAAYKKLTRAKKVAFLRQHQINLEKLQEPVLDMLEECEHDE